MWLDTEHKKCETRKKRADLPKKEKKDLTFTWPDQEAKHRGSQEQK